MGQDKRFLLVGGQAMIARTSHVLQTVFERVSIVLGTDCPNLPSDLTIVQDIFPNRGSLGGIYTGLKLSRAPYIFVAGCDMPFLNPALIRYMVSLKHKADLVVARTANGLQMTHALYGRGCLSGIEAMVSTMRLKIQDILALPSLQVRIVEETEWKPIDRNGLSFVNVNTPEEWEAANRIAENWPIAASRH